MRKMMCRGALALLLGALLLPLLAVPAQAENGEAEPCWVEVAVLEHYSEPQVQRPDFPQYVVDRAEAALAACVGRNAAWYADQDSEAVVPLTRIERC